MAEDHRDVIARMTEHWEADRTNREDALDDLKFRAGDQWPATVRAQRERDGRPILTVNRIPQFVKRVSGSLRQSHPAIEPIPVDDRGDPQLVEIMAGIIRQIEYQSQAGHVYAWGAECAIACGIGHWQIKTRYCEGTFDDQEAYTDRILDPLSVIWDGGAVRLDRDDAQECYVTEWTSKRDRKRRFKEANDLPRDLPTVFLDNGYSLYWRQGAINNEQTRIASRWWKEPVEKEIGVTREGQVFDLTQLSHNAKVFLGIVRARKIETHKIMHQAFDGGDYLTDAQDWAGYYIPIVPVIGEEIAFDGNTIRHGIIRWAKDPQRLYNYFRSAAAEMIALAPKAPFVAPMKSIKGLEHFWNVANTANLPYLPYNEIEGFPELRPERSRGAEPPAAMWREAEIAQDDMKATTGIYDAALGARSNETSGVAIENRQNETDTGTFIYFDNFNVAIQRTGTIYVDLIPKLYDGERTQRIIGEDNKEAFVPLNKIVMDAAEGPIMVNDLSATKYDVRIKTGPSYANAKEIAKRELGALMQANPRLMGVFGDKYIASLDLPASIGKEIEDRIKRTIPPAILNDPSQQQKPEPDPLAEEHMKLDLEKKNADVANTRAQADGRVLDNEKKAHDLMLTGDALSQMLYGGTAPPPPGARAMAEGYAR